MRLGVWSHELPNNLEFLGFAIKHVDASHVGILYHLDDGLVKYCHFAWYGDLRNEPPHPYYLWGNCGLDRYNKRFLASNFDVIRAANPNCIPYGIDSTGSCFDENKKFLPLPLGKGMTCATFILAVFASYGLPLVDAQTWPVGRVDDKEWAQGVMKALHEHHAPQAHIDAMQNDIVTVSRFRPSEVAGAIWSINSPITFAEAQILSQEIMESVRAARTLENA